MFPKHLALSGAAGLIFLGCSAEDPDAASASGGSAGEAVGGASVGPVGGPGAGGSEVGAGGSQPGAGGSVAAGASGAPGGASSEAGAPGSAGAAGSGNEGCGPQGPAPGAGQLSDCAPPPAESPADAVLALNTVNTVRVAMGLECMQLVNEINDAARLHCEYYAMNRDGECEAPSAHSEVEGCPGYVSDSFAARMRAAGYEGQPRSEVMAFANDPERSVYQWINTAFHRTPLLNPWIREMGYGAAERCDTIDLGRGPDTPADMTGVYPYPGQTGAPLEFHGNREGPTPEPAPPDGWPSADPVHVYARDLELTSYRIDIDCTDDPLDVTAPTNNNGGDYFIFYANEPYQPNTTYRVRVEGESDGRALSFDWTFTTGDD